MNDLISGYLLGLSLIVAIGAQNAFVLRQGLRRSFVFAVCLTCALSDAILIAAGVAGFGWLVERTPWLMPVMRYFGAAFLLAYGAMSLYRAWRGEEQLHDSGTAQTFRSVLLTALALTWLNPHVYLDTVVLLGAVATSAENRYFFGLGAVCASFSFFFTLGYGAQRLAPVFEHPQAWRVLDLLVAMVMWALAIKLVLL